MPNQSTATDGAARRDVLSEKEIILESYSKFFSDRQAWTLQQGADPLPQYRTRESAMLSLATAIERCSEIDRLVDVARSTVPVSRSVISSLRTNTHQSSGGRFVTMS